MARILVAEDEDVVRAFVVRALQSRDHDVVAASDGGLAAEEFSAAGDGFDLVLSDIRMPVMDGIALALDIAAKAPALPILLMTGFADQRERAHGLDALVYDVLLKPFSLSELLDKVEDALAGRPPVMPSMTHGHA